MAREKKSARPTPEPLSKRDIYITRFALGAGALGLFFAGGGPARVEGGIDAAAHALYKSAGRVESVFVPDTGINTGPDVTGVPSATMDYLKSLPTERTEIPEGGGIDDAAYAVDPSTFDESPDIRQGVEEIIADEVGPPGNGNFIVPAHAQVDVPVVPPLDQVPPEAR